MANAVAVVLASVLGSVGSMTQSGTVSSGSLVFRPDLTTYGVKIFSATMFAERDALGEKITGWLRANPHVHPTEVNVTQSSDEAFHCLSITLWYHEDQDR